MTDNTQQPQVDLNQQLVERKEKLKGLREKGVAFPNDFRRDSLAADIHEAHGQKDPEVLVAESVRVHVAGRMMLRRIMGKASFATIQDMSGQVQLYVARDNLAEGTYNEGFKKWDLGDIVGASGTLFFTKTGELTIQVDEIRLLTKALRPLPDKFHGLADQETRYRQRYLDLIVNEKSRETFLMRSKAVNYIRQFLSERSFLEVETPMMHVIPGGATARPFVTHHNALDMDLYLRIAPELYLKRLVVGGFEKVFEINRSFRNEGLSTRHNPEFTMLEFYWGYADYKDLMDLTEEMLRGLALSLLGTTDVTYQGQTFHFGQPFARLTVLEAILKYNEGVTVEQLNDLEQAKALAESLAIKVQDSWGLGKVQIEIFEATAEDKLMEPTFITAYPAEVSPLARRNDDNPFVTERFEMFVGGREIANGFSELNDAEDQA
ncbi:MAG TPA: lysine--tRNA ligase, partial [Aliidiomarina sp.]|nr:lysine--tRNA ligase [Aliidiomarina sp.]